MTIYQPAEDSWLLSETLEKYLKDKLKNKEIDKDIQILDMGSGSGIQAQTCKKLGFNNVNCADINQESVNLLKNKGFDSIQSNLFSNINKKQKFDLIIFNPPYLPEDKREPKDSQLQTTAGKKGCEIILEFLKQSKHHLNKNGAILLLFSSLSKPNIIKNKAKELDFKIKKLNKKNIFFEQLFVDLLNKTN